MADHPLLFPGYRPTDGSVHPLLNSTKRKIRRDIPPHSVYPTGWNIAVGYAMRM